MRHDSTMTTHMCRRVFALSFKNMTDKEWDQIQEVHLKGSFACSRAAWPIFIKQKFGRIVNTASAAGIYGKLKWLVIARPLLRLLQETLAKQTIARPKWVSLRSPRRSRRKVPDTGSRQPLSHR